MNTRSLPFRECCFKNFPDDGRKLVWEVTHQCKFGCPYCFQTKKRLENRIRILHPSDSGTVIHKMADLSVRDVLITGGEVYWVRDSLTEICDLLSKEGIAYSISTSFIHDELFMDSLLELHPRALNISLDPRGTETKDKYNKEMHRVRHVQECHPFLPSSAAYDLVVSPALELYVS